MNLKLMAIASVAVSLAAAAGCVAQPSDTLPGAGGSTAVASSTATTTGTSASSGNNDSPARRYFVMNVHPALATGAQPCVSCHATGMAGAPLFLDKDPELAYANIETFPGLIALPENSLLIHHGLHTGPDISKAQSDTATVWLGMEAAERGLDKGTGSSSATGSSSSSGGMSKPTDLTSALALFAKCMDPNDWKNAGLTGLANAQTNGSGACNNCHNTGDYGNYLNNADASLTFSNQKVFPYVKRWVSGTYDMDGNFTGLKAVPREYLKAAEAAKCDKAKENCHPTYTLAATLKTGIDDFISKTLTKMANNACP